MPGPVLTEFCDLLERQRGSAAEASFLQALANDELRLIPVTRADLARMVELVTTYADLPLSAH